MKNTETTVEKKQPVNHTADNQKVVANHKKAADHFAAAAKNHLEAAKHLEDGHHEKAAKCIVEAHAHSAIAQEAQKENAKHHVSKA
jgi:hypothetical protein